MKDLKGKGKAKAEEDEEEDEDEEDFDEVCFGVQLYPSSAR